MIVSAALSLQNSNKLKKILEVGYVIRVYVQCSFMELLMCMCVYLYIAGISFFEKNTKAIYI